jgi:hypothetical protein
MKFKQWGVGTPNIATILFRKHNKVRCYQPLTINITMSGMISTIRDDTHDEAMFRSWNKQKREYQDEIQSLTNEVSKYQLMLDEIQKRVISGDVSSQGRDKMNKKSFNKYHHSNRDIITSFCKRGMFPQYTFLQPSYMIFSLENKRSLCYKINQMIERLPLITSEIDEEFYWVNYNPPLINKKYCEIRLNLNTEVKKRYIGK